MNNEWWPCMLASSPPCGQGCGATLSQISVPNTDQLDDKWAKRFFSKPDPSHCSQLHLHTEESISSINLRIRLTSWCVCVCVCLWPLSHLDVLTSQRTHECPSNLLQYTQIKTFGICSLQTRTTSHTHHECKSPLTKPEIP